MPSFNHRLRVTIRHWLPIVTFCPVNNLPDLLYVSIDYCGTDIPELYRVRKELKKLLSWKKIFMEDAAILVSEAYDDAAAVQVRLAFNRHVVTVVKRSI